VGIRIHVWLVSGSLDRCYCHSQWRRLHGARGHVPPLLQMAEHGGGTVNIEEQQTRNWQNCIGRHESAHQSD